MPWETKVIGASGRWVKRNRALSGKDRCLTFPYHAWDPSPNLEMDPSSHRSGRQGDTAASVRIPMSVSRLTTAKPAKKRSMIWTGWLESFQRQASPEDKKGAVGQGITIPWPLLPMANRPRLPKSLCDCPLPWPDLLVPPGPPSPWPLLFPLQFCA